MSDIRQWLDSLGLGQYADAFEASVIDSDVLSELDHDVLKEIGVAATGDRLRILKAARALVDGNLVMGRGESRPSTAQAQHHPGGMAERRHLTVMFCDLVGSTELSQTLDPEDLRDLMRAFQDRCAGAVSRFDGFVARYMGDGLLVYFGYPRALEDAPERSVRAGLEVVSAMDGLRHEFGDASRTTLAVRVGIATGTVVVGDIVGEGASAESAVVGETPNLAARLQGEAQPDQIVIADATRRLLGDRFQLVDLGSRDLKGIAKPAHLWGVDGELTSRSMHVGAGSGPVVGREEELAVLSRAWDATRHGQGQVVLLSGEPGIGKSRLVESLRERIAGDPFVWTSIRCSPHHTQSAFFPVVQQLRRAIGALATDTAGKLESLEDVLQGCGLDATGRQRGCAAHRRAPVTADSRGSLSGSLALAAAEAARDAGCDCRLAVR
jgi:class 3 adenylate cyclase